MAEVLFEEPATIRNAVREMEPLNRSHPTLASFVAEHAEALVAPGIRASLAQASPFENVEPRGESTSPQSVILNAKRSASVV